MERNDYYVEIYNGQGWEKSRGTLSMAANHLVNTVLDLAKDLPDDPTEARTYVRKQVKDAFIRSMDSHTCPLGTATVYIGGVLARVTAQRLLVP